VGNTKRSTTWPFFKWLCTISSTSSLSINSGALRFIPKDDLEKQGYAKYKALFEKP
jgi:hypothetical protein